MILKSRYYRELTAAALCFWAIPAVAQVDQAMAAGYFKEAAVLCEREAGRLWGVNLCGPMALVDPVTHTIATNQPAPAARQPPAFGYANAAMDWGGTRWTTIVWQMIPADQHARASLMLHELFHRIQPQLGLLVNEGPNNDHLDTLDGRYWMQLEWRALAQALGASGPERASAVRHALAFRLIRRKTFGAPESERGLEINEGLPQYTATAASNHSNAEAAADAIDQLKNAERNPTFVRTFPYPLGAAYGVLLEASSPGWTRRVKSTDDLGELLMAASHLQPAGDPQAAARLYGGAALRVAEEKRDAEQKLRVTELRRRFVEGPVIALPGSRNSSFTTTGMTAIPGEGTIYPGFRTTAEWGTLEAAHVLMSVDRGKLTLPAPANSASLGESATWSGDGWTLKIAEGWKIQPGSRAGDFQLVRKSP